MIGIKERNFRPLPDDFSLEVMVPKDNFYRCLEERIDLPFVRELVLPLYAKGGRHSIDPVIFFKLQLVLFFENLRARPLPAYSRRRGPPSVQPRQRRLDLP